MVGGPESYRQARSSCLYGMGHVRGHLQLTDDLSLDRVQVPLWVQMRPWWGVSRDGQLSIMAEWGSRPRQVAAGGALRQTSGAIVASWLHSPCTMGSPWLALVEDQ